MSPSRSLALVIPALLMACTEEPGPAPADAAVDSSPVVDAPAFDASVDVVKEPVDAPPPDYLRPPDVARTETDEARAAQRLACTFRTGAWPAETLGREVPVGDQMPIDHIIVVMQENLSLIHISEPTRPY